MPPKQQPQQPYYPPQPQQPQQPYPGMPQPQYYPPPTQQMVKTYRSGWGGYAEKKFEKDAAKLAQQGWRIQSQSTTGVDWLARRPQNITVVYVR